MKTIGLLGGMSWESTLVYYRFINEAIRDRLGGLASAKICLFSVNFGEIEQYQRAGNWGMAAGVLARYAKKIEDGGADFLVICTNTMHKAVPEIEKNIRIPVLHIADATAERIRQCGLTSVGLLGTRFTMEEDFYKGCLERKHHLRVLVPPLQDRRLVNRVIYRELCAGRIIKKSRNTFLRIIRQLTEKGAEAVILGCTEINLLLQQKHTPTMLFDTTIIHAEKAVAMALDGQAFE